MENGTTDDGQNKFFHWGVSVWEAEAPPKEGVGDKKSPNRQD